MKTSEKSGKSDPKSAPKKAKQKPGSNKGRIKLPIRSTRPWKTCQLRRWTSEQRDLLLKSFKKAYADDWLDEKGPSKAKIKEISARVPDKAEHLIEKLIATCCWHMGVHKRGTDRPLDKWLEVADAVSPETRDLEKQLGYVMMVASQEPMEESNIEIDPSLPSPDYPKIYKYLLCAVANKPLPPLSPVDSLVVEECVQSLAFQIKSLRDDGLKTSLRKVYLHLAKKENYEQELDYEEIRSKILTNASMINPLGLNSQAIVPVMPDEG